MKDKVMKNKTILIIVAAVVVAAIGFAAGMMVKSSMAQGSGNLIGAEKAKTIALESVGVSPEKATFTKVEIDKDFDKTTYDIEFCTASNEYEFEINATNGDILEKNSEAINTIAPSSSPIDSTTSSQTNQATGASAAASAGSSDYIGIDKAKSIALKSAGISSSNATFTKTKLDSDDGIKTYEIEFVAGNTEYDFEINALTGDIMSTEREQINGELWHHDEYDDHHDD